MAVLFRLREVRQSWSPPFDKKMIEKEFCVEENTGFGQTGDSSEPVFRVIKSSAQRALIEYRRDFALKGHQQPSSRQVWLNKAETKEFSLLWGNNGVTKKLTFNGTTPTLESIQVHVTEESKAIGTQQTISGSKVLESIEKL